MIEFLEFTFQSFWHWAGVVILASAFGSAIGASLLAIRSR
jgi:hypothetical protein